jgi:hypothetical protein
MSGILLFKSLPQYVLSIYCLHSSLTHRDSKLSLAVNCVQSNDAQRGSPVFESDAIANEYRDYTEWRSSKVLTYRARRVMGEFDIFFNPYYYY